jgi:hypothetical protein
MGRAAMVRQPRDYRLYGGAANNTRVPVAIVPSATDALVASAALVV